MKRKIQLAIGLLVSVAFLYLAMRNIDWVELWAAFQGARYWALVPAMGLLVVINLMRAFRWRLLMGNDRHVSLWQVYRYVNVGYLFNNILPAKAGEVVRAYLVSQRIAGGLGQAVSSLLLERLLDVLTLVVLLVVLIPFVALPEWAMQGGLLFGAAAVVGTIVLVILAKTGHRGVDRLWEFLGRVPLLGSDRVKKMVLDLVDGFNILLQPKLLPGIVTSSLVIWLGYATFNYMLMVVFRIEYLPFAAALLVLCATGFSMVIPSSPGAMGVFEWAGVQALYVYNVQESLGFGYMLGLHLFTNLSLIAFGLVGLMREGVSYAGLRQDAIDAGPAADAGTPAS